MENYVIKVQVIRYCQAWEKEYVERNIVTLIFGNLPCEKGNNTYSRTFQNEE